MSKRRLRIAVLNRQFSVTGGGAERYSIALVEKLAEQHDIHVFAQQIDHHWPGVTYHRVSRPISRPRWLNQLWYATATWWATRKGFDVVHSHENTWHGNVQTMHVPPVKYNLFHGKSGVALGVRWLKVLTSPRLLVYLWLEWRRLYMFRLRSIVATSGSLLSQTIEVYPDCRSGIQVLPPGVDLVPGAAEADQKSMARQRLGLPLTGRCVLMVGNDYRKKGLLALLGAMSQLPTNCYLAVVGNPSQIPQFKALTKVPELKNRVFFLGSRKEMNDVYSAADCLAHPTLEDTFAMVVLEAMAHGLPVVVSDEKYCGISALLAHEVDALLLENPTISGALANSIKRVLEDGPLHERLVKNGMAFANNHRWKDVGDGYNKIYNAIANQTRKCQ